MRDRESGTQFECPFVILLRPSSSGSWRGQDKSTLQRAKRWTLRTINQCRLWVIRDWDEASNSSRHVGYVPESGSEIRGPGQGADSVGGPAHEGMGIACSASASSLTGATVNVSAADPAAASIDARNMRAKGAVSGLKRITARATRGAISLSSSTHKPPCLALQARSRSCSPRAAQGSGRSPGRPARVPGAGG
jgi:hypothetical protein